MNRLFLAFCTISAVLIKINAQNAGCVINGNCPQNTAGCPIGESDLAEGGFCNQADGDAKCKAHCEKTYGKELTKPECSAPRENKQRECICHLKCAFGGCYGDPHCWGWDHREWIGYQSLKPYHIIKPRTPYKTLPKFEIIQKTAPVGASVSGVNAFDLVVPDWGQILEVSGISQGTFTVLLNKERKTVPFRYSKVKGHREEYIDVRFDEPRNVHLVVTTSFGVKIETTRNGYDSTFSIPRHPELFNNTKGLLGNWNDDKKDDNIDANGKAQPLDFMWSVAYGDSFLLKPEDAHTQADLDLAKKLHDQHVATFNKEHWEHLKKMCESNLHHEEIYHCQKWLGHPTHLVEDCVIDLSHIIDEEAQHKYLETMVSKYNHKCPHHSLGYKRHKRPRYICNHRPIHHPHRPRHQPMYQRRPMYSEENSEESREQPRRHRHRGVPKYMHQRFGPAKQQHKDQCFNLKKQFHKDGFRLWECLKFEELFDEDE
jgi:hypothetical protein